VKGERRKVPWYTVVTRALLAATSRV
jgi:hypothetical protein